MRHPIALLLLAACFVATAARANPGDLNRCVGPDGRSIYTDKPCDEVGAIVKPAVAKDPGASEKPFHVHVHDCARTLAELRDGLHAALVARDVNKATGFYHWPGVGNAGADGVFRRFDAIVARPILSVDLVRSHAVTDDDGNAIAGAGALVIVQGRGDDASALRTELGLVRNMGCWWVRF